MAGLVRDGRRFLRAATAHQEHERSRQSKANESGHNAIGRAGTTVEPCREEPQKDTNRAAEAHCVALQLPSRVSVYVSFHVGTSLVARRRSSLCASCRRISDQCPAETRCAPSAPAGCRALSCPARRRDAASDAGALGRNGPPGPGLAWTGRRAVQ
jgi:hypothetical protein